MVGIVIVSHSQKLAESVVEYTKIMADGAHIAAAGGNEDGSFGTSFDRIFKAVKAVDSEDGVIVIMDLGSAVMTTEMVIEAYGQNRVQMADCPILEGAVVATIDALSGIKREMILETLKQAGTTPKF